VSSPKSIVTLAPILPGRFLKTDAPHSLKVLKTLIRRDRKKLDKKQNPNPGLTTRYCVLCYNPRVVSISSGAAPASNSRAFEDWIEVDRRHQQFS
jgi:hypothetical protein